MRQFLFLSVGVTAWAKALLLAAGAHADGVTYANPILTAGRPADPDVLVVDGVYYLYATTHGRGYDVFTSQDLVHWTNKGRALDDPRGGAWAPDLYRDADSGQIYLYYTDDNPEVESGPLAKQIGVAVADNPLGPFEDRRVLVAGAIDAHLFRDDDGKLYLYYASIEDGFRIMVQPMTDPLTPAAEAREVLRPTEPWEMASGHVTEGPFLLKHDGLYYLMYSGSGADSPHYAIGYATAKSPLGPFEKYAGNPIAKRREGLFGPGHHCVVEGPDRKLWMVYHQKADAGINWQRFLAIDPLWFDDQGVIHTRLSRGTPQPGPAKAASE